MSALRILRFYILYIPLWWMLYWYYKWRKADLNHLFLWTCNSLSCSYLLRILLIHHLRVLVYLSKKKSTDQVQAYDFILNGILFTYMTRIMAISHKGHLCQIKLLFVFHIGSRRRCARVRMLTHVRMCLYLYVSMPVFVLVSIYMHVYVSVCMCLYVCVCISMCIMHGI